MISNTTYEHANFHYEYPRYQTRQPTESNEENICEQPSL